MDMRVNVEFLTPGVQDAEEADFCTEMLGIARDFQEAFRTGAKQEIVDDFLVLQNQRGHMTRKCEDHMDVTRWEKLLATCCQVIHLRLLSMNASPAVRTRSATSRSGRSIYAFCGGLSFRLSESRGLAVALR